jgi:MinD-like ATPase involved in chromosome partitioning or flagellar assembly
LPDPCTVLEISPLTPDRPDHAPEDADENGILSDTGSLDTARIGILGGSTAQVSVSLPVADEDDLADDDVIGDEVAIDELTAALEAPTGEQSDVRAEIASADASDIPAEAEIEEIDAADVVLEPEPAREDVHDHDIETAEVVDDEHVASERTTPERAVPEHIASEQAASEQAVPEHNASEDAVEAARTDHDADTASHGPVASATVEPRPAPPVAGDVDAEPLDEPLAAPAAAEQSVTEDVDADAGGSGAESVVEESVVDQEVWTKPVVEEPEMDNTPAPHAASGEPEAFGGALPATRRAHHEPADRGHEVERVHPTRPEVALTSKRLDEFEAGRESSDLLTADRLLDHGRVGSPEPEGAWQHFVYSISGGRINLGDGRRARARKELDRRIAAALPGGARFVPVLSRKGGVGKTTITTLLGMALADARDDRVIAIDANPDRGTLAERIARPSGKTVRDLVRSREEVNGYNDISTIVARDETRLDVLASDADPRVSEAFSDLDYQDVASIAAHYYSIVLTDTGTGIVHSVMGATLDLADELVIVAGLSVDEARLASETITWLETNGFAEQARNAVVVLNNSRPGAPLVRQDELEAHFRTRVRAVVRMPYDPLIGTGSAITFRELQPETRAAARELAAVVVEGLRALATAA